MTRVELTNNIAKALNTTQSEVEDYISTVLDCIKHGIIKDGRLLLLYTHESDIGDGWEDAQIHNDSEYIRLKALQMGANILEYVFEN